jgi:tRNA G26 N,N-dimethylase Trm1
VAKAMAKLSREKFLKLISEESNIPVVGFYNIPKLTKKYKLKQIKQEELIKRIKKKGCKAEVTHFAPNSIRSDIEIKKLIKLFK